MTDRSRPDPEELIDRLAADLTPVSFWQRPSVLLTCWLLLSVLTVLGMSLAHAAWRPGALVQLTTVPQFALEILVAAAGICTLIWATVQSALPGALRPSRVVLIFVLSWAPWLALLVLGLYEPALTPSMAGKREDCYLEVMVESLPPLFIGLLMLRRLYPLRGWQTGALLGFASGMIPALLMQLSCMYLVDHAWTHHLAPVLVPALMGAAAGGRLLRR
ncbi:MAG: NrsF family protein [Pseudomonadota bacterium]